MNLSSLSDQELLCGLKQSVVSERGLVARVVAYLAEVESRRLELKAACPSLYEYCVLRLGMSEGEALRRMTAARLVRRFPMILELLERGELHLTSLRLLKNHLTEQNHEELLREACGKTKEQLQELVAKHFPRPDVPTRMREIPAPAPTLNLSGAACTPETSIRAPEIERARLEPLSEKRYRMELTVTTEIRDKLRRAANLMSHRNPSGDMAEVLDAALTALLAKLEKERLAKTDRPRKASPPADPGTVTRAARRETFERDGERCAFVDTEGNRCPSLAFLEMEHRDPRARGGRGTSDNTSVYCRSHNRLAAEEAFGREFIAQKISQRQRRSPAPPEANGPFEQLERGLRHLGFRATEIARALGILRARADDEMLPSVEQLLRDALAILS
jgi:hypothetical protein